MMDTLSLIVAVADNGAIGVSGGMPWHISADFKYFKRTTMGHPVVMGRGTWRSLGCKCLKGRKNIVVTHSPLEKQDLASGAVFCASVEEALEEASGNGEIFVIGGGSVFRQILDRAGRLYITRVHTAIENADTFFPEFKPEEWKEVLRSVPYHDDASGLDYEFMIYEKIG